LLVGGGVGFSTVWPMAAKGVLGATERKQEGDIKRPIGKFLVSRSESLGRGRRLHHLEKSASNSKKWP